MDYEKSILNYQRIINKYPSHKDLDYFYYMIAMCNYEQLQDEALDGYYNDLALSSFKQVIKRFPNSKYSKDSRQKIILVKSNIAAKHMEIGRFYLVFSAHLLNDKISKYIHCPIEKENWFCRLSFCATISILNGNT